MPFDFLRRWGAWRLLAAWCVYWLLLALVVLGAPAVRVWRLARDPASHAGASVNLTNDLFSATVVQGGATVWAGSVHLVTLALWLVVPPLLLYVLWLRRRPPRGAASARAGASAVPGAPPPEIEAGGGAPSRPAGRGRDPIGRRGFEADE